MFCFFKDYFVLDALRAAWPVLSTNEFLALHNIEIQPHWIENGVLTSERGRELWGKIEALDGGTL